MPGEVETLVQLIKSQDVAAFEKVKDSINTRTISSAIINLADSGTLNAGLKFLKGKIDLSKTDEMGLAVAHYVVSMVKNFSINGKKNDIFDQLAEAGVDFNKGSKPEKGFKAETTLHFAVINPSSEGLLLFLDFAKRSSMDITQKNELGLTISDLAFSYQKHYRNKFGDEAQYSGFKALWTIYEFAKDNQLKAVENDVMRVVKSISVNHRFFNSPDHESFANFLHRAVEHDNASEFVSLLCLAMVSGVKFDDIKYSKDVFSTSLNVTGMLIEGNQSERGIIRIAGYLKEISDKVSNARPEISALEEQFNALISPIIDQLKPILKNDKNTVSVKKSSSGTELLQVPLLRRNPSPSSEPSPRENPLEKLSERKDPFPDL